jgi:hypothetical protein
VSQPTSTPTRVPVNFGRQDDRLRQGRHRFERTQPGPQVRRTAAAAQRQHIRIDVAAFDRWAKMRVGGLAYARGMGTAATRAEAAPVESPFIVLKFLHIATMFTAVAATVFPEVILHLVANTRDARAIATAAHVAERIGKVVPALFIGGAIFGLLAAWAGEMNFLAPWLIASYVLFVTAIVVGALFSDPWVGRLKTTAVASGDAPTAELEAVIDEPRAKAASAALMVILLVMIGLMVFKPGG